MRIFSIDGRGIRGIIPGHPLIAFGKKLREIAKYPIPGEVLTCQNLYPDKNTCRPTSSAVEAVERGFTLP